MWNKLEVSFCKKRLVFLELLRRINLRIYIFHKFVAVFLLIKLLIVSDLEWLHIFKVVAYITYIMIITKVVMLWLWMPDIGQIGIWSRGWWCWHGSTIVKQVEDSAIFFIAQLKSFHYLGHNYWWVDVWISFGNSNNNIINFQVF